MLTRGSAVLPASEVVRGDVRDPQSLPAAVRGVDAVCHLAGVARVRGAGAAAVQATNAAGTANLLAALGSRQAVPVVLASTAAVYGGGGRLDEDSPLAPASSYGESKLSAEQHLRREAEQGRVAGTALRCFNVAGASAGYPDRDTTRILNRALAVAAGRLEALTVAGDGGARRDYVHVADVATAFRLGLARLLADPRPRFEVYNVGSGHGVSVNEIVDAVQALTGRAVPVLQGPAAPEVGELVADPTRAWRVLDWEAQLSATGRMVRDAWAASRPATRPAAPGSAARRARRR